MRNVSEREEEQCLKELDVYGYSVFKNLMSPEKVSELLGIIEEQHEPEKHGNYDGRPVRELSDMFLYNLQYRDKRFLDILDHESLRKILKIKLNDPYYKHLPPDKENYILGFYNARSSGDELPLHTDTFIVTPGPTTWTMQVFFALNDSTIENGCSIVVPGSHRTGKFVDRDMDNVKSIEMKAGDVGLWDSRLWHGTHPNVNKKPRWFLFATVTCWWVKQRTNMVRGMPEEMYNQLSERQKQFIGFCSIPPRDEHERLNFKCGYDVLKPTVKEYL